VAVHILTIEMEDEYEQIFDLLSGPYPCITEEGSFMVDYIDSFALLSRENPSIKRVELYPFHSNAGNYEFWDKVGQIVGNLMELKTINIHYRPHYSYRDEGDDVRMPDWETLARILPYLRSKVVFCLEDCYAEVEDIRGLARAIHGQPMISGFEFSVGFTFASIGPWCSALSTLPSLERIQFGLQEPDTEDQRALLSLEPLKELLRTPALRSVMFHGFNFTNELCHATANALEVGSSITDISFNFGCSFPDGGRAIIVNALKTNATVTNVRFLGHCDEPSCDALAIGLLCNSTLLELTLWLPKESAVGRWLCPIFFSLGMNITLKSLSIGIYDEFGDELCTAISNGLAKNSTLEKLSLYSVLPGDDDGAVSAHKAFSFLSTNSTLLSLKVAFARSQEVSYVSAFRSETVKMIENAFLESLTIIDNSNRSIKAVELLALISALPLNTTLKTLDFHCHLFDHIHFTDDEVNQLVSVLMKNYGLERLVPGISSSDDGTVQAILRLNAAGRRYLIKDASSISKGVDVLSAVSNEIDCVFLHLLENPSLCDRRATDTTPSRWRPGYNLDESSGTGKRERALSQPSKEAHRRLA
jgi:hypothetical protein